MWHVSSMYTNETFLRDSCFPKLSFELFSAYRKNLVKHITSNRIIYSVTTTIKILNLVLTLFEAVPKIWLFFVIFLLILLIVLGPFEKLVYQNRLTRQLCGWVLCCSTLHCLTPTNLSTGQKLQDNGSSYHWFISQLCILGICRIARNNRRIKLS